MMSVMAQPERVLVTGAAGFVRSTLVDHPYVEGREITAFDSFDEGRFDDVFHLAALSGGE